MASLRPLTRSNPEAEGIPSPAVLELIRSLEQHVHPMDAVQGFLLRRHGNVAAEGWTAPFFCGTNAAITKNPVGYDAWISGTTSFRGYANEPISTAGAWASENSFEVRLCYPHSFFCPVLRFRYGSADLKIEVEPNVSWDLSTATLITGNAEP